MTVHKTALAVDSEEITMRALAACFPKAGRFDHDDPALVRAMSGVLANTLKNGAKKELARLGRQSDGRRCRCFRAG